MIKGKNGLIALIGILLVSITSAVITYFALLSVGAIESDPIVLKYEMGVVQKEYDGQPLAPTAEDFELIEGQLLEGHTASFFVEGSLTEVGQKEVKFSVKIKDGNNRDVTDQYLIESEPAVIKVTEKQLSVNVLDYEKDEYLDSKDFELLDETMLAPGHKMSCKVTQETIDGQEVEIVTLLIFDMNGMDVTKNYNIYNQLFPSKEPIKLTIKAASETKQYDGKHFSSERYQITSGKLVDGHRLEVEYDDSEKIYVNSYANSIVSYKIFDRENNDVTHNYDVTPVDGTLTITKREVKVYASSVSKEYDGMPIQINGYDKTKSYGLLEGDVLTVEYSNSDSFIDADDYSSEISEYTIYSNGIDVTDNYDVDTLDGTIKITKKNVTVNTKDLVKTYDGETFDFTRDNLVYSNNLVVGHVIDKDSYNFENKSRVDVVDTINTIDGVKILNEKMNNVTDNYNITYNYGDFKIEKRSLTVYGKNVIKSYDGKEVVLEDYEYAVGKADNHEIEVSYNEFKYFNAGEYKSDIKSVKVLYSNKDITNNYNIICVSGTVKIEKVNLFLTALSDTKDYDGKAYEFNDSNFKEEGLNSGDIVEITYGDDKFINAGSYASVIKGYKIKSNSGEESTNNYNVTLIPGSIIINKKSVEKPSESTEEFIYDKAVKEYTLSGEDFVVSNNKHTNAGTYYVEISLKDNINYQWEDGSNTSFSYEFVIKKAEIQKPHENNSDFEYDGKLQEYELSGSGFVVSNNKHINAGTYTVEVSLEDNLNYQWEDGTNANLNYEFIISKKTIDEPTVNSDTFIYDGSEQEYELNGNGFIVSNNKHINAGTYTVEAALVDSMNYQWEDGTNANKTYQFVIKKESVKLPIEPENKNFKYTGIEQEYKLTGEGFIVSNNKQTNAGTYTVEAALVDSMNYQWEDGTNANKTYQFVIKKESVKLPIEPENKNFKYTGIEQEYKLTGEGFIVSNNKQTNAGTYTVEAQLKDSNNYQWADGTDANKTYQFVIKKESVKLPTEPENKDFKYTGSEQEYKLTGEGFIVSNNKQTNAGTYTVEAQLKDSNNYQWEDGTNANKTYQFVIKKASVTKPEANTVPFIYDGKVKEYTLSGEDFVILNNKQTNAGTYIVEVQLKDNNNYQWADNSTSNLSFDFVIKKAVVTKPSEGTNSLTYNGLEQEYDLDTNDNYRIYNNKATNVGIYIATVQLIDPNNYAWDELGNTADLSYPFKITKYNGASITGVDVTKVYDGTEIGIKELVETNLISGHRAEIIKTETLVNVGSQNVHVEYRIIGIYGEDATNNYDLDGITSGNITISKRKITIKSDDIYISSDALADYPLNCGNITVLGSLGNGDYIYNVSFTNTGKTGTQLGDSSELENEFDVSIQNSSSENVKENYEINYIYGTIVVYW